MSTLTIAFVVSMLQLSAVRSVAAAPVPTAEPWQNICDQVGMQRTISVEMNGVVRTKTYIVGSPAQECPGRCGPKCDGPPVYTEQCLAHDACVDLFGDLFAAECAGDLFSAVHGYMAQEVCTPEQMSAVALGARRGTPGRSRGTRRTPRSVHGEIDF